MVDLTKGEIELIIEALDSHVYWQLSDTVYRREGYVREPGAEDPQRAAEIVRAERLSEKLAAILRSVRVS